MTNHRKAPGSGCAAARSSRVANAISIDPECDSHTPPSHRWGVSRLSATTGAVLLSYVSEDADAARRLCKALCAAGIEVWLDQSELRGGDTWDAVPGEKLQRRFAQVESAERRITGGVGALSRSWLGRPMQPAGTLRARIRSSESYTLAQQKDTSIRRPSLQSTRALVGSTRPCTGTKRRSKPLSGHGLRASRHPA